MANNNKKTENATMEAGLGEISTIRDILMGQYIHHYDAQFERMQEEIDHLREQLEEKIAEVDRFHKLSLMDLSKGNNQRFNKLEKSLAKQVNQLEVKILSSSVADKKELGKMMANVAKKLMGE